MTDDLTPEERDALNDLPRERTPSTGLEDRVVAAMRDRGHLARRSARVVRITNTRVLGLLAACAVLVIGAYSIGLYRGVDRSVLTNIEPRESGLANAPSTRSGREPDARLEKDAGNIKGEAPPLEWKLKAMPLVVPRDAKEEHAAKEDEVNESVAGAADRLSSNATPPAPASNAPAQMQVESKAAPRGVMKQSREQSSVNPSRTFALKGGTLIVDAPDSVRVVQDAQGGTLLIYTSEGIIRIRLAD